MGDCILSATISAPGAAAPSPLSLLAALPPSDDASAMDAATGDQQDEAPENPVAAKLKRWAGMANIAEDPEIPEETLNNLAQRVVRDFDLDDTSRADWKAQYQKWLDFAMQVAEEKTYPWPQASNVIFPLITTAAIQFAARAYPAIIRDRNVVKGTVVGDDDGVPMPMGHNGGPPLNGGQQAAAMPPGAAPGGPAPAPAGGPGAGPGAPAPGGQPGPGAQPPQQQWQVPPGAKQDRADEIGRHMSWQLLDEQPEWEPQTDRLLIVLPIVGCMFRKSYFDPGMKRNVSEIVSALDLVVNYKAKSFETAPRKTEIVRFRPWEIETHIRSGIWLDDDYLMDQDAGTDEDGETTFLEQHRRYDLDGDGYAEPYIITVAKESQKLARIRAGWEMDGVTFNKAGEVQQVDEVGYYTKYGFVPSPDSGVYDLGFGHLLFPINEAINSALNQMFDAGHLQNAGGGFIGSNLSMNSGAVRFALGEYKQVQTSGATIRDSVFPIPFQGPSQTLFELMQFLVTAGKEIAAIKDIMVGDMPGDNTSGITTLAVIEQGLQVFSAIYKRIYRSLKAEFDKLFRLNRIYLPLNAGYQQGNQWRKISRQDYEARSGVEPVSDPRMMTDMQRLGKAQFLGTFKQDPWFDQRKLRQRILDAAQIPDAEDLLVQSLPPNPDLMHAVAKLQLSGETLEQRKTYEAEELALRRGKDLAAELESRTRAILNLANAQKADHASAQGWYEQILNHAKLQVEQINAQIDATAAGGGGAGAGGAGGSAQPGGAPAAAGGAIAPTVPAMAPPPGQPPGA